MSKLTGKAATLEQAYQTIVARKQGNSWARPSDYQRIQEIENEMRALGYALYKGQWLTEEEFNTLIHHTEG